MPLMPHSVGRPFASAVLAWVLAASGLCGPVLAQGETNTGRTPSMTSTQVLRVGPGRALASPSAAARIARDGAQVLIDAGDYVGDVAVWSQDRLTLRGHGGRARLHAAGRAAEGKAIWVIQGDDVVIEDIELEGTRVPHHNGAGIRAEGGRLTIRHCRFADNEMGILTNNNPAGELDIQDSELDHNTTETEIHGKLGHNLYVGRIRRLRLRDSLIRDAREGHLVKSRAAVSLIEGNRLIDRLGASYLIDLAEGGSARVVGNVLEKSRLAPNRTAISYAAEADRPGADPYFIVKDNRYRVAGHPGVFVRNHGSVPARLQGNRLPAGVAALDGPGQVQ